MDTTYVWVKGDKAYRTTSEDNRAELEKKGYKLIPIANAFMALGKDLGWGKDKNFKESSKAHTKKMYTEAFKEAGGTEHFKNAMKSNNPSEDIYNDVAPDDWKPVDSDSIFKARAKEAMEYYENSQKEGNSEDDETNSDKEENTGGGNNSGKGKSGGGDDKGDKDDKGSENSGFWDKAKPYVYGSGGGAILGLGVFLLTKGKIKPNQTRQAIMAAERNVPGITAKLKTLWQSGKTKEVVNYLGQWVKDIPKRTRKLVPKKKTSTQTSTPTSTPTSTKPSLQNKGTSSVSTWFG